MVHTREIVVPRGVGLRYNKVKVRGGGAIIIMK